jgi:hypothetical protein
VMTIAALVWPSQLSTTVAALLLLAAVLLLVVPAGSSCDLPIVEFVPHALEDAAGPHFHDRCQLESDRRSLAGLLLIAGAGATGFVLLLRRRGDTPAPRD